MPPKHVALMLFLGLAVGACQSGAWSTPRLAVDFSWRGVSACTKRPPAFHIGNVPDGTRTMSFWMTDLDSPDYAHGGGTVAYAGSGDIPQGAFSYMGPCPPTATRHRYVWTVRALDDQGDVLAKGEAMQVFPPE